MCGVASGFDSSAEAMYGLILRNIKKFYLLECTLFACSATVCYMRLYSSWFLWLRMLTNRRKHKYILPIDTSSGGQRIPINSVIEIAMFIFTIVAHHTKTHFNFVMHHCDCHRTNLIESSIRRRAHEIRRVFLKISIPFVISSIEPFRWCGSD